MTLTGTYLLLLLKLFVWGVESRGRGRQYVMFCQLKEITKVMIAHAVPTCLIYKLAQPFYIKNVVTVLYYNWQFCALAHNFE